MRYTSSVLIAATIGIVVWVGAGDLTPPGGAIGPTMKTLTEVEPRTAIATADMPKTISSPGSYYLVEDITTAGNGITITSDEVTIDLNGFSLVGGTGAGISVPDPHKNITIKNGTVRGWASGGIAATSTTNSRFQDLAISNNGTKRSHHGLRAGDGCIVRNCTSVDNAGDGIRLSEAATITGCVAVGNGSMGIRISSGTVTNCSARNNVSTGISASGAAVIAGCSAIGSTIGDGISAGVGSVVKNCSAVGNGDDGITITFGEVRGCSCYNNDGDGIHAGFDSIIIGNSCSKNNVGIDVGGRRSRIEGNNVLENASAGIGGDGVKNLIIRNSAARNSPNYDLAADNAVGEIVDVTGSGGVPFTSGSPWANFVHEPALP
ncbi:MAG: right-handed parallel beta-helix repeat-containing protein [Planctomycetes bacterium]|nr:right-handed parallel beta-helix repeat-containing protein [Planctomycetota bacterium]